MLRNYILIAWRNLTRHRLNAGINIVGLSVAFMCCILLFLMVHYEFSVDSFHKNGNSLYELYNLGHAADGDKKGVIMSYPMAPALKSDVPGISRASGFMWAGGGISYKNKEIDKEIKLVDKDFFNMFSFTVVSGQKTGLLSGVSDVVISKSTADALFGTENPVGKVVKLKVNGNWKDLVVSAVIEDAPENSSINYDILARMDLSDEYAIMKDNWNQGNHFVFVQTDPGFTQQQVESGLRNFVKKYHLADDKSLKSKGYRKDANGDMFALKLASFSSLHFDDALGFGSSISKPYLYTLSLIALVVLAIACFNFINLNVARAFTRAKEVGIRKTIGAGKRQIFLQLWTESILFCVVALLIGLVLGSALLSPFNDLFTEKLHISSLVNPSIFATLLSGILLVSFLAGGYPAWLISRFSPVSILKGKISVNRSSVLRNGLIAFQFILSSLLICSTIVIYRQFQFLRNAPLGIVQESVISIPVKNAEKGRQFSALLRSRLYQQPQIMSITGCSANIGIGMDYGTSKWGMGFVYNGKTIETNMLGVDYDFFSTMGVKPVTGRDFSHAFTSDTSSAITNVVITESLAKLLGKTNAVGLSFYTDSSAPRWNVIGIVPDIHFYSMHEKAVPLAFVMSQQSPLRYILVKVKTANPLQTMRLVKSSYEKIEPDNSISPSYLADNIRRWYEKEQRLSSIFFSAAAVAIILSCLGLFALVALVLEQRRKEIGVRKVLGASISGITALLSRDFLKVIALAYLISVPIAWYFLNQWLQNFVYQAPFSWWIFPFAGLLSIIIALATISFQTVKASLANPVESLRSE